MHKYLQGRSGVCACTQTWCSEVQINSKVNKYGVTRTVHKTQHQFRTNKQYINTAMHPLCQGPDMKTLKADINYYRKRFIINLRLK